MERSAGRVRVEQPKLAACQMILSRPGRSGFCELRGFALFYFVCFAGVILCVI